MSASPAYLAFMRPYHAALFFFSSATAQVQFGQQVIIEGCETELPRVVLAADLDGDGDLDVISGSERDDRVAWYANDGSGVFGPQHLVSSEVLEANWVHAADLDADGDVDLLVFSWGAHELSWFANDGAGSFSAPVVLASMVYGMDRPTTADVDGDGDTDIVACSAGSEISWYPNDGAGGFGAPQPIDVSTAPDPQHAACADLDNDGDVDIVYACQTPGYVLNNGDGTFAAAVPMPGNFTDCRNMEIADMNGDGILDAVGSSYYAGQHSQLFLGNGDGSFATVQHLYGPGNTYSIPTDADGDGDPDMVSTYDYDGTMYWYANDGTGVFGTAQEVSLTVYGANCLYSADLDGDGDQDLLSASGSDDKIAWYRNDGLGAYGPQLMITEAASDAISAFGADLDGDGDNDVAAISFSDHKLAWYPNDGAGTFGPVHRVTLTASYPQAMCYGDMDGDGDTDILVGTHGDSAVSVYKNNGLGVFDTVIVIDDDLFEPSGLNVADLDGDGDLDVMTTSWDVGVFWYRNQGGDQYTGTAITTIQGAGDVIAADLDNDGDKDLIYDEGYAVRWKANNGTGGFGAAQTIYTPGVGDHLCAADMDGDGDQDVVLTSSGSFVVCLNDAGTFTPLVIDNTLYSPSGPQTCDPDVDGDTDVLVCSAYGDYIVYYENLGGAVFAPLVTVTDSVEFPTSLSTADLNADGKPDVIATADNEVYWYAYHQTAIVLSTEGAENDPRAPITIWPNPMGGWARLVADRILTSDDRIELLDPQGRVLRSLRGNGSSSVLIERQGLVTGTYIARLVSERGQSVGVKLLME